MESLLININSTNYPSALRFIGNSPENLFYKGIWNPDIFKKCLAVVGSRRMTQYGENVTRKIISEVALSGITIVSGFMYGIDATAHKYALESGGRTIAIMPCGIEDIIPEYQKDLYEEIINNSGLIISEYKGHMNPQKWTFYNRNRLVAGLSQALLVVEASEKSGTLITAKFAKRFGRKIFAIPQNIDSKNSLGIVQLLREGAYPVSSPSDIMNFFGIYRNDPKRGLFSQLGFDEKKILEILSFGPQPINKLALQTGSTVSHLVPILTKLELKGIVSKVEGNYHIC